MNTLLLASVLLGQCCGGSCGSCGPCYAPPAVMAGPCPGCVCGPGCGCPYPGACFSMPVQEPAPVYPSLSDGRRQGRRLGARTVVCYVGRTTGHPVRSNGVIYCRTAGLECISGSGILITENMGLASESWTWYPDLPGERAPAPSRVRTGPAGLRAGR